LPETSPRCQQPPYTSEPDPPSMALRTLMARVRTSAAALRLQTPALSFSPLPGGRPNLHSAAAAAPRLPPPAGGRPCFISTRNLIVSLCYFTQSLHKQIMSATRFQGYVCLSPGCIDIETTPSDPNQLTQPLYNIRTRINLESASKEELEREASFLREQINEFVDRIHKEKERSDLIKKDLWASLK
uniref:Uncharacterized protein n=1 Tax=Aegilops tauschii subsp. strangulata TaxID=200361 RepID=A0A453QBT4_AEGTS